MDGSSTVAIDESLHTQGRRRRRIAALGVVLAVSTVIFGLVLGLSALWETTEPTQVALPEIGVTAAASTDDDVPIWVVHTPTGSLHVLDAVDPSLQRDPGPGDAWASDWCPVGRYFESPWGARFDEHGASLGGASRHGLTRRGIESIDADAGLIEVGEPSDEPVGTSDRPRQDLGSCTASELVTHPAFEGITTLSRAARP